MCDSIIIHLVRIRFLSPSSPHHHQNAIELLSSSSMFDCYLNVKQYVTSDKKLPIQVSDLLYFCCIRTENKFRLSLHCAHMYLHFIESVPATPVRTFQSLIFIYRHEKNNGIPSIILYIITH